MSSTKKYTAQDLKAFLDGTFTGDPTEARSFCEQHMNPKLVRVAAGGDRTDFERGVEKVGFFRANCKRWDAEVKFFAQDGNKIAARLIVYIAVGEDPEKHMELMFMAELDEEGRFLNLWEQATDYLGGEE
ncbi:unnamed protein product [Penicillium camemberti]|uniref:Str. FM013 n=1 Tax=Penicillium camemberti (strain FM 013) TaxID=1429867 RepID=A0A0G4NUD9_PENC3|nr:unnamed protein product [Penicillium camemberti]